MYHMSVKALDLTYPEYLGNLSLTKNIMYDSDLLPNQRQVSRG